MKRVGGMGFREIMWGLGDHEDCEILRVKISRAKWTELFYFKLKQ